MKNLFEYTLKKLEDNFVTSNAAKKINNNPLYDRKYGERICNIMFEICEKDMVRYDDAIKHLIEFSKEFLELQHKLDKTGSYQCKSFEEAKRKVYDNPEVMEKRYLNGLFLSQAFWINHYKIHDFFIKEFCKIDMEIGKVLEVPTGTGLFVSEFMNKNGWWFGIGYDLSKSSVKFSRELIRVNGNRLNVIVEQEDVFNIQEDKRYDRIICGELLEHLDNPEELLQRLIADNGKIFLTTAIWAANIDHVYLFESVKEVREMIRKHFIIEKELVLNVFDGKNKNDKKTPINYACVLRLL